MVVNEKRNVFQKNAKNQKLRLITSGEEFQKTKL